MGVKPDITEFVGLAMARIFYFEEDFVRNLEKSVLKNYPPMQSIEGE